MRMFRVCTLFLCAFILLGCPLLNEGPEPILVESYTIDPSSIEMTEGDILPLSVSYSPKNADKGTNYVISVGNTTIASVDEQGNLTALKAGTTTVRVSSSEVPSVIGTATLTVKAATIPVTSVAITNEKPLSLKVEETAELTVALTPSNANEGTALTFTSSDTSVTTVDSKGKITAVKAGNATITVSSENGKKDTISVVITAPSSDDGNGDNTGGEDSGESETPVPEKNPAIALNTTSLTLNESETATLTVTYTDIETANQKVTWSSNDTSIATVDSSGKITAVKAGNTTITATYSDTVKATCAVTVEKTASSEGDNTGGNDETEDDTEETTSSIMMNGTSYETLEKAFASISTTSGNYVITLTKGTYNIAKGLAYKGAATIKIMGDTTTKYGSDVVILGRGSNMDAMRARELIEIQGSGNFILENITLQSDYTRAEDADGNVQAEVLGFDSTGYVAANNCSFISHQDTLRTTGKAWFYNCYISGDVDFIWMEQNGIVALYEECEIVSRNDEVKTAYIAAPRASISDSMGKGVVIYNSTLVTESGVTNYLFRNPWGTNTNYYNQAAFINITLEGNLEKSLTKSPAMGTDDQQYIGWKIDQDLANSYPNKESSIGIVSADLEAKEYSGRRAILNRKYLSSSQTFIKDTETYWDIDSFIANAGWTVSEDTSKDLLDGDITINITTWDFTSEYASGDVSIQSKTGEVKDSNSDFVLKVDATTGKLSSRGTDAQFNAGTKIQIPVSAGSIVTVTVYDTKYVLGGEQQSTYTSEKAGYVLLEATGNTYLNSISVTNLNKADDFSNDVIEFEASSKTVENNESVLGIIATSSSSSDSSVATAAVTDSGIVITSVGSGSATITVTNKAGNTAIIPVTVGSYGALALGTITPYSSTLPETVVLKYNWESESDGGTRVVANGSELYGAAYSDEACTVGVNVTTDYTKATITGTFKDNSTYVQTTADATMQIPVSSGSVITISFWDSNAATKFSLAGSEITSSKLTLNLSGKNGNGMTYTVSEAGYVELKCTSSYYIRYITVSNLKTADVKNHTTEVK